MSQIESSSFHPPLSNDWQLLISLLNGRLVPGPAWKKRNYRLKFLLRTLIRLPSTRSLLKMLAQYPLLPQVLEAQPYLPSKLHRPYLAANMNREQALTALCDHYRLIQQCMPKLMQVEHLLPVPLELCSISGKHDEGFSISLGSLDNLNKEGEITLQFCNSAGVALAKITFSLMYYRQLPTLFIGGLQGPNRSDANTLIQQATKSCFGLFPKRMALEALCCLAHFMGIQQVIAVGDRTHIYQNWRYRHKKQALLHASYDDFWRSVGGVQNKDGYFHLPNPIARKSLDEIASKKRAEYRHRFTLLDRMAMDIGQQFNH